MDEKVIRAIEDALAEGHRVQLKQLKGWISRHDKRFVDGGI